MTTSCKGCSLSPSSQSHTSLFPSSFVIKESLFRKQVHNVNVNVLKHTYGVESWRRRGIFAASS
ncbi:hypothetical protein GLYMA_02G293800v4 [Glycine max]|uniref:Uncharacterized protein n=1 Tax=Glycine max TaxID=3847 RepID=A0A0R0L3G6_SOYBN|nr:hypothetical protein JHK85_005908 [Glycine max]KRH73793.1 hypothetical protein GLYMA_02G293800v4 [Glycine max]